MIGLEIGLGAIRRYASAAPAAPTFYQLIATQRVTLNSNPIRMT